MVKQQQINNHSHEYNLMSNQLMPILFLLLIYLVQTFMYVESIDGNIYYCKVEPFWFDSTDYIHYFELEWRPNTYFGVFSQLTHEFHAISHLSQERN
jgi:hypothetical protein